MAIEDPYNFMKKCNLLLLAISLVVLSFSMASAQNTDNLTVASMNATFLKELVAESESYVDSYRFTLIQSQNTEIVNQTDGNVTYHARLLSLGSGAFNLTGRSTKVVTAALSYPTGQQENAVAVATEVYIINDTAYSEVNGNWTAIKLPLPEDVWLRQNRLNQSAGLTNASNISLLGIEIIDGKGFYIVEVIPESSAISSLVNKQLGSSLPSSSINLSALFNNTRLRYVIWISMDSHLPQLEYVETNMTVTPEMLGLPSDGNMEIRINSVTTLNFSGFNESVNIVLPDQAMSAELVSLNNTNININTNANANANANANTNANTTDEPSTRLVIAQAPSQDQTTSSFGNTLTPEEQQQMWLSGAYLFLNGNYYTSSGYLYNYPYGTYYTRPYYPYYAPYYYYPYYTRYYYTSYYPTYWYYSPYYTTYSTTAQGYTASA